MGLTLATAPSDWSYEPMDLDRIKDHLRYAENDEDHLIAGYAKAAREYCETFTGRQFVTGTYTWTLDRFPGASGTLWVPRPNLQSVTSINYIDTDGATQALALTTDYVVGTSSEPGRIVPAYNTVWPSTRDTIDAVTVVYVAGYGAAATVPEGINAAILLLTGHWFENRESVVLEGTPREVRQAVDVLLWSHRVLEFV